MILLHVVLLFFFSYDKSSRQIQLFQISYFMDYALGALIINYLLLPKFYYNKKYIQFAILVFLTIVGIILIDEYIVDKIYFPDTRGKGFPGIIYTLLQVMPIIIILVGFKFAWDASKKQKELDQLKALVKDSELQYLKSQINPHFLFNNLNNLYAHVITNSSKAPSILLELSSVLRYMLYECHDDFVPLSKELENLQNFTKLSKLQIEGRGNVEFNSNITDSDYQIAPLILSVFLENAFKHSSASQGEGIRIEVSTSLSPDGVLSFTCINSFQKISNTDSLTRGIGLPNVRKRLDLLYTDNYKLEIKETESVYHVKLKLRLNKLKE